MRKVKINSFFSILIYFYILYYIIILYIIFSYLSYAQIFNHFSIYVVVYKDYFYFDSLMFIFIFMTIFSMDI